MDKRTTKSTYEYSLQTMNVFYSLLELIVGMFVITARESPTILISIFLQKNINLYESRWSICLLGKFVIKSWSIADNRKLFT